MYNDLKEALTEDNLKQTRITYKYSENDLDETKIMPNLNEKKNKEYDKVKKKRSIKDIILIITGSIFALLVAGVCLFAIIYPQLTAVPEIQIPEVSNLSVVEAENILREKGLNVTPDLIEKESDLVEPGKVIGTNPQVGRTVKEGTEITIIVAKESGKVLISDYTGTSYKTVEVNLKNAGLNVILEPKTISKEEQSKYKENTIVEQSVEKGTKLAQGDTIVIYYAVFIDEYPNFVTDSYTVDEVQSFCDRYNVNLIIDYVVDDTKEIGTIIKQNRSGEIIEGQNLTITVTKKSSEE